MVLYVVSIKVSANLATGSSDRANLSDSSDIHRVRKDTESAQSSFQCSVEGSSSLGEVFRITGK